MTREIFCFRNNAENVAGRLVPNLILFFKKVKPSGLQLRFNIF